MKESLQLRLWNLNNCIEKVDANADAHDITNDVINLGKCFSMFVYIRARFSFLLISGNLTAQSTGSHRGIGGVNQIPETLLQALLLFPAPPPVRPGELARRLYTLHGNNLFSCLLFVPHSFFSR